METPLERACAQLLRDAGADFLDRTLEAVAQRVADDDARELLLALYESGSRASLREVLQSGELAAFASERCTPREEHALLDQLARWLGSEGSGGDDPARLAQVPAPPPSPGALLAWADAHELTRELMRPASEVFPELEEGTLFDACRDDAALSAFDGARAYLHGRASARAGERARAELHARALPEGALGLLARRLRAVMHGHELAALSAMRFVPARAVELELASGVAQGALVGEPATHVELLLSGYEQRPPEHRCSRCGRARCAHVAALAARLLDACLDPGDRLHAPLQTFASVPSWKRFLGALQPAAAPPALRKLSFVLRERGGTLAIGVRSHDGGKSKLVSPAKLARARVDERDRALLSELAARTRTLGAGYVDADAQLLRALIDHPALALEDGSPLTLMEEAVHVALLEQPEGLLPRVTLGGAPLEGSPARDYVCRLSGGALVFAPLSPALRRMLDALAHFRGVLPPESFPELAVQLEPLRSVARIDTPRALDGYARPPPDKLLLRLSPHFDEGLLVSLAVRALPLAPLYAPGQGPSLLHGLEHGAACSVRRDLSREREQAERVRAALRLDDLPVLDGFVQLVETRQGALELLSAAARISDQLEIEWAERARPLRVASTLTSAHLGIRLFKHGDFCELEGQAMQADHRVAIERLLEAARVGERFVSVGGGDFVEIERALFERLEQAQLFVLPREKLSLESGAVLPWLAQLGDMTQPGDAESEGFLAHVREAMQAPAASPPALSLPLRDYQRQGVAWMLQRSRWARGVCLADEMGLGKTIQAVALLVERAALGPALVVAPTSVVDNWLSELGRFAPSLRAQAYRGGAREPLLRELAPGCVLVTSYDVMLRDAAKLAEHTLSTLVLDEAQMLKNARTQRARAASTLDAQFRVALSGTPVENRLGDLWSLFHVLSPGLLGSWSRFRARFAVPIERYQKRERADALRALVSPFVLRRTKREVATELPTRTDVVHSIDLSQAERDLYAAALAHARRALGKRKRGADEQQRAVQILAELTRLRQLACHPRLVLDDARVTSSKLQTVLEGLLAD